MVFEQSADLVPAARLPYVIIIYVPKDRSDSANRKLKKKNYVVNSIRSSRYAQNLKTLENNFSYRGKLEARQYQRAYGLMRYNSRNSLCCIKSLKSLIPDS